MPEVKKGDVLNCEVCGLTVIVNQECDCEETEIFCCEEPMINKGSASKKSAAPGKKTAAKKTSPAAKKKTAKTAVKTAAKKAAAKKAKK